MATRQREKKENREKNRDRRPMAEARYIRIPSSKIEIVLDLIRGKSYVEAVAILSNTNKSACEPVLKVLNSAAANAENNNNIPKDSLIVAECYACEGPTLKRMMPRARGRADRIFKRSSHITVVMDENNTKGNVTKKEGAPVKKAAKPSQKKETAMPAPQKKAGARPAEIPDTQSERPLTNKPNTKKPLGTKKDIEVKKPVTAAKSAVKPAAKKESK